jgi:hypothetical protein
MNMTQVYQGLQLHANANFGKFPQCFDYDPSRSGPAVARYQSVSNSSTWVSDGTNEDSWWYRKVARIVHPKDYPQETVGGTLVYRLYDQLDVPDTSNTAWWQSPANSGRKLYPFEPQRCILRCPGSPDPWRGGGGVPRCDVVDKDRVYDDCYGYNNYGFTCTGSGSAPWIWPPATQPGYNASNTRGICKNYHDTGSGGLIGTLDNTLNPLYVRVGNLAEFDGQACTILLMDYVKAEITPSSDGIAGYRFRHAGKANVLFASGRIEGYREGPLRADLANGTIRFGARARR